MKYQIFKKLDGDWMPTSYIGDKHIIEQIWRNLSTSKVYLFDVRECDEVKNE